MSFIRCITAVIGLFLVGITPIASAENVLSDLDTKSGWQSLFNGRSLDGWRGFNNTDTNASWSVNRGTIECSGRGRVDLISTEQYGSFELMLEYKISAGGNSGLMFHVTEEHEAPWHSGPEVQIIDNGGVQEGQKTGWLYDLYSWGKDATRPAGTWNEIRIRVTPGACQTFVNSVRYPSFQIGNTDWNQRVANSKFAKYPNFGKAKRGHICLQNHDSPVWFRNIKIRNLDGDQQSFNPVDGTLPLKPVLAFPDLEWADWSPVTEDGLSQDFRPVQITHAGDGTNRLFVATQRGTIHVFDNRPGAQTSQVFLDIGEQTEYRHREFERGLLGLAFHPQFKENGQFYICYTTLGDQFETVVSKFHVDLKNPHRADPASEQEIMRFAQPYWNHDGGTILFGPDGYLYLGFGDGGSAGDPDQNGQNLGTVLGKVLRIDVDHTTGDLPYAIPDDNPFVEQAGARGEIWAYGLRNVWGMAFDPVNDTLWAADVGQNLYEEINILRRGRNYGWNRREGMHSFGEHGTVENDRFVEPIWEYDHSLGKSITGGLVYRGKKLPELFGHYLYVDFISGRLWALHYDYDQQQVTGNFEIAGPSLAVTSFGEDEAGEVYFVAVDAQGKAIYRFEQSEE